MDFEAFLKLLPDSIDGVPLRHVLDVRHPSFLCSEYLALARRYKAGTVFTDSDDYPPCADVTGDFVYTRMMRTDASLPLGCTPETLDALAACGKAWRDGGEPAGLPKVEGGCDRGRGPARRLHVLHQRREGKGPGRGDGPEGAAYFFASLTIGRPAAVG